MAEYYCFFNKDTNSLIIKAPKKSPAVLRMVVLAAVILCSIYICFVCLKQTREHSVPHTEKIKLTEKTCHYPTFSESQLRYVNYPRPTIYSREECSCTPVRLFAIVSMQRSGSGWFETLLNSHEHVSSHGEIFFKNEMRKNMTMITKILDKVYNLDWNSSASKRHCTAAVGFKWMLNQGLMDHYEDIVDYFNLRGVSAILLLRRNHLRRLVSLLANIHDQKAKQLNGTHLAHVHSKDEADILARFRPKIDIQHLMSTMQDMNKWSAEALQNFKNCRHMVLYYEDLVQNRTKMRDVLEFLNVPQRRLVSRHVKIHRSPLKEQIENWDSVVEVIKGSQYESFLAASDYQI
ncbi:uncharacterized protein LOC110028983 isoform X2 [Phalaenopsis equestris]|uniref:uncharacterized protein LOC110028983 isoform X2 n=1 Tax=Phalaenopsis equestris TaxID=78828 RepID=UPI0009E1E7A7|nr:uncharacterized protein LOC110028983 isoform X2 [Phalaenopsis equestris]